jgi:hypothetical protein
MMKNKEKKKGGKKRHEDDEEKKRFDAFLVVCVLPVFRTFSQEPTGLLAICELTYHVHKLCYKDSVVKETTDLHLKKVAVHFIRSHVLTQIFLR